MFFKRNPPPPHVKRVIVKLDTSPFHPNSLNQSQLLALLDIVTRKIRIRKAALYLAPRNFHHAL